MTDETKPVGNETAEVTQTPTQPVEDIGTLKQQLQQLSEELNQTKKGLSTAHQTLTQKDQELKRRGDLDNKILGIEDRIELLATAIASGRDPGEVDESSDSRPKRQDILADLARKKNEQDAKRKQEDYNRQADSVYERAKVVFADDEDSLDRIDDYLRLGKLEQAERRVAKAEQPKQVVKTESAKSVESEEQRIDRLVNERLNKVMKEKNLLIDETGGPSAVSASAMEATALYARGAISESEARKRGVRFD